MSIKGDEALSRLPCVLPSTDRSGPGRKRKAVGELNDSFQML